MRVSIYIPLLAALVLGLLGPWVARRLPPATATRLLTAAAAVTAAATTFVLGVLAFTLVARLAPVAELGKWSARSLAAASPVPSVVAAAAVLSVVLLAVTATRALVLRARAMLAARDLCRRLGGGPGELVLVDDGPTGVDLFALPVGRGRIVATRRGFARMAAVERRVALAHEHAHLRLHHHRYRLAVELAAAVNPALRPLVPAMRLATERWADEAAAVVVGDRPAVARALANVALQSQRPEVSRQTVASLAFGGSQVVPRVRALIEPQPRRRPVLVIAAMVLLLVTGTAAVDAEQDAEHLFEHVMIGASGR